MFLRGMTPDERILDELRVIDRPAKVKVPAARMFPVKPQDSHFYEREKIAVELYRLQSRDLWVAREQALPEGFKPDEEQVVWTAGLSSWRKLARRGVWVHGCAESLGEHESERLEILLGRTPHFLKLSHNEAEEVASESGEKDFLATYKLKTLRELPDLRGKTHFYWLSYSSFRRAVDAYPEILKGQHACGPGNTATLIAKHAGIQPEIFVSHSEWFNAYKEG